MEQKKKKLIILVRQAAVQSCPHGKAAGRTQHINTAISGVTRSCISLLTETSFLPDPPAHARGKRVQSLFTLTNA